MQNTKFIDLSHDYGFKIVFADPKHQDLLIRFLNEIIPERTIVSLTYLNPEVVNSEEEDKRYFYDLKCTDEKGNVFIVEMQKKTYAYFGDRVLAYSGAPLSKILKKGESYDKARVVYVVSILGESLIVNGEGKEFKNSLVRRASVTMNDSGTVLSDKLNLLFLQLSAARRPEEADSFLEKFAWYVKSISTYDEMPDCEHDTYFQHLFDVSNRGNISKDKLSIYDKMVRDEIQIKAELDYAVEQALAEGLAKGEAKGLVEGLAKGKAEGLEEGEVKGKIEIARKMLAEGFSADMICRVTGLSEVQVESF